MKVLQWREPDEGEEGQRVRAAWARSERMAQMSARIAEISLELQAWNLEQRARSSALKQMITVGVWMFDDAPEVMTIKEASMLLKLHHRTLYNLIHAGRLPYCRIGSSLRILKPALIEWLGGQNGKGGKDENV